ncbi:MAG: magnesium transporter [Candidatus Kapaibacterium sp.]
MQHQENQTIPTVAREMIDEIEVLVESGDYGALRDRLSDLHPADIAGLLEYLQEEDRHTLLSLIEDNRLGETVLHLPEEQREEYLDELGPSRIAEIVDELDPDDAADVISELSDEIAEQVLGQMQRVDSESTDEIRELLRYDEETAGGRMTTDYVSIQQDETVASAIENIRDAVREYEIDIYVLYVVDAEEKLVAFVRLQDLVLHSPQTLVSSFMVRDVIAVTADEDQELVAQLMQRYDLIHVPVVDNENRLLGIVTFDDIAEIIEEEASEDILYMVGVTDDEESPSTPAFLSLRRRLPWLIMNLGTAFIASMVVSQFEGTIGRVTALAALMPIVAGMGGNAAVQSIVVMVRSIALGDFGSGSKVRALVKEVTVGLMNGLVLGLLAGCVVWGMWGSIRLGILIALAMFVNLIVAGLVGTTIPLLLRKLKFDPALSSGPIATTFTDVCGFLTFLGLATLTLSWLLG